MPGTTILIIIGIVLVILIALIGVFVSKYRTAGSR